MDKPPVTKRGLLICAFISLSIVFTVFISTVLDRRTKLVFCDVGQGDAAYIRTRDQIDILIDAGPNKAVASCLGHHMPFYDKQIEIAILSHAQKDHYGGYLTLLDSYRINKLIVNPETVTNPLIQQFRRKGVSIIAIGSENILEIGSNRIIFYWPPANQFTPATDPNSSSLIFSFEETDFRALFTGDATAKILERLSQRHNLKSNILKIPHHGSKTGLTREFLELADPALSVISVGKKNSYGHPSKQILDLLKAANKKYVRTDKDGDIVIRIPNYKFQSQ